MVRSYYITSLVRLANGGASYVEVYFRGAWSTVCDDLWDIFKNVENVHKTFMNTKIPF